MVDDTPVEATHSISTTRFTDNSGDRGSSQYYTIKEERISPPRQAGWFPSLKLMGLLPWVLFLLFILAMLGLDLGVFNRKAHVIGIYEAVAWSVFWIVLSLLFALGIYFFWHGQGGYDNSHATLIFLTCYLIEKSLSVDNLFVFLAIFSYFSLPAIYQHGVLFWGIMGALIMRGLFIFAGVALIEKFSWMIYLLGGLLIITGIKMMGTHDEQIQVERNPVLRLVKRFLPVSTEYNGRFFCRIDKRLFLTPMAVVLIVVETTDLMFAIDSIPAVLGVTTNAFLVYTSNVFAILGLRALYFALAGFMKLFCYLTYGLATILLFIGGKMLAQESIGIEIPVGISLLIVAGILFISVLASLVKSHRSII